MTKLEKEPTKEGLKFMKKQVTHQIKIGEKIYAQGIHEFSEEDMDHPHFKHYSKAGRILTPAGQSNADKLKTEEAMAKRREMEAAFGVPRSTTIAPSSDEVKVEEIGGGFETKAAKKQKGQ